MNIKLNEEKLKESLLEKGLDFNLVKEALLESGLPLEVTLSEGLTIEGGEDFKIQFLNCKDEIPKKGNKDILTVFRFKTKLGAIEDRKIKSIELPKLDSSCCDPLVLKIEYLPNI